MAAAPGVTTSFVLQIQLSDVPTSAPPASSVCLLRFPVQCHASSPPAPCISLAILAFKLVTVHGCANCAQLLVQLLRFSMSFLSSLSSSRPNRRVQLSPSDVSQRYLDGPGGSTGRSELFGVYPSATDTHTPACAHHAGG